MYASILYTLYISICTATTPASVVYKTGDRSWAVDQTCHDRLNTFELTFSSCG